VSAIQIKYCLIHPLLVIVLFLCLIVGLAWTANADNSQSDNFLKWAKKHAHPLNSLHPGTGFADLHVLKEIIGEARIVGIGESVHATHEFSSLQHRIIEFLVIEMGFTAVAVESGLAESKHITT